VISEITPNGYSIHQIARNGKTGGGVDVIHKSNIEVKRSKHSQTFSHFHVSVSANMSALFDSIRSQIDVDLFFTDLALSEMREILSMA
jgi:hypothetical protein